MSCFFPVSSSHLCKVLCNDSLYANKRRRERYIYIKEEEEEERERERERERETLLVFNCTGSAGPSGSQFIKRLASKISDHRDMPCSQAVGWLRCIVSFALLRSAIICLRGSRGKKQGASIQCVIAATQARINELGLVGRTHCLPSSPLPSVTIPPPSPFFSNDFLFLYFLHELFVRVLLSGFLQPLL